MLLSKLFKHCKNLKIISYLLTVFFSFFIVSCEYYEFNGEIEKLVEEDSSSIIYFKKTPDSPVAFSKKFKIGENYSISDLPDRYSDDVWNMYPGYDLGGWKTEDSYEGLQTDENGYVTSFHMSPKAITLYGDGYTRSNRTPYTIVLNTQNISLSGYNRYSVINARGTTDENTSIGSYISNIPGYLIQSYTDMPVNADGSTVVNVYFDRKQITITINDPVTSFNLSSDTNYFEFDITYPSSPALSRPGYSISSWSQTFGTEETIVSNLPAKYPAYDYTYTPIWLAQSVPYTVVHKLQDTNLTSYTTDMTETKYGTTDTLTNATARSYPGFTLQGASVTQENIEGDGSTEVEIRYDRNTYKVTFNPNNGTAGTLPEQNFIYGVAQNLTSLSALGFTYSGYSFQGWATTKARADAGTIDFGENAEYIIGAGNATIYAVWQPNAISITIDLPDAGGVGIECVQDEANPRQITLNARYINDDGTYGDIASTTDGYTFRWFYTEEGLSGTTLSTDASFTLTLTPDLYNISLIATKAGVPTGGTIQIRIE